LSASNRDTKQGVLLPIVKRKVFAVQVKAKALEQYEMAQTEKPLSKIKACVRLRRASTLNPQ
jgi:hypothetical protein